MVIVSVTGHRALKHPFDDVVATVEKLLQQLKPDLVVTGMALGFDQAVAYACLKNDIPFEAAVPCDGQEAMWTPEQQEGYKDLLGAAAKITVVSPGKYAAWKMHAQNGYMVKRCNVLIAYCHPRASEGGTVACVKLAQSTKGKQILNMYDLVGKPELIEKASQASSVARSGPSRTDPEPE